MSGSAMRCGSRTTTPRTAEPPSAGRRAGSVRARFGTVPGMDRDRLALAGAAAGTAVVGFAAGAHVAAGGALAGAATLAVATAAAGVGALGAARMRWTFWRLVVVALAAQPVLHLAINGDTGAHHGHHSAGAAGHASTAMVVAHLAVALVAAVTLRWGLRWVRTLPALARALAVPSRRGVAALHVVRVRWVPVVPAVRRDLAVLAARGSRGPPR